MSVAHNTDVTSLFFVNNTSEKVMINVAPNTMSRHQAGELLTKITVGIPQPSFQCGYSVTGGGNVHWFSKG